MPKIPRPRNINATKLTTEDIKKIRQVYATGELKINALSKRYRVGAQRIINVIDGKDEVGGYVLRDDNVIGGGALRPVIIEDVPIMETEDSDNETKKEDNGQVDGLSDIISECNKRVEQIQQRKNERLNWYHNNFTP